jgi:dihydropyrimidinase
LVFQGVVAGHISEERWVEVCSTAPAKLFGIARKGSLEIGNDADVVIFDPAKKHVLSAKTHHMNLDHSAYEGMEVIGAVRTVISRGDVIVNNGTFVGRSGRGRYLRRDVSQHIR